MSDLTETHTWECRSGELIVSDPGYPKSLSNDKSGWTPSVHLEKAKKGTWTTELQIGEILGWGMRVKKYVSWIGRNSVKGKIEKYTVAVDSGQMSVCDYEYYPDGDTGDYEDEKSFYGKACQLTTGKSFGGDLDGRGVVSSSGIGDGMYDCIVAHDDDGKVVNVKVVFVGEQEKTMTAASLEQEED